MQPLPINTSREIVVSLLQGQFPQWATLPLKQVQSAGTDNTLYRLGDGYVIRLPKVEWALGQVEKEQRWLPYIAPHLPIPIPQPVSLGQPTDHFQHPWSIYQWLDGEPATLSRIADTKQLARDIAHFVQALQQIPAEDGPAYGAHNSFRGAPLSDRDAGTRRSLNDLKDEYPLEQTLPIWEAALEALQAPITPTWLHGDIQSGNLLAKEGHLCAVIDFGCLGVGDPACDYMTAWTYLPKIGRNQFRDILEIDNPAWRRAQGWALSFGAGAYAYYKQTNKTLAAIAKQAIEEVIADFPFSA